MHRRILMTRVILGCLIAAGCAAPPAPPPPVTLQVNVFPGSSNLPLLAGINKGFFARRGVTVEVQNTPNSDAQCAGLPARSFEIAHAAIDNAVAMVEVAKNDVIIVMGGDSGMNEFKVRPEIATFADIRGKSLAVDAPNTACALVAKKILKNKGLIEGRDYTLKLAGGTQGRSAAMVSDPELAAGMVNPPFSFTLRERGIKSLGRATELAGPYQATGAFVMRAWAAANASALERYLAAYIESSRYAMVPVNRAEMEGQGGGRAPDPAKFLDLTYYDRSMRMLDS